MKQVQKRRLGPLDFHCVFDILKLKLPNFGSGEKTHTDIFTNSRPWSTEMSTLEAEMALDEQLHEVEESNKTTRWDGSSLK